MGFESHSALIQKTGVDTQKIYEKTSKGNCEENLPQTKKLKAPAL